MSRGRILSTGLYLAVWLVCFIGHPISGAGRVWCQEYDSTSNPVIPSMVAEILVDIQEVSDQRETLMRMARNLIVIQQNEPFSDSRLKESLEALNRVKLFDTIESETRREKGGVIVAFRLTPYRRIKRIRIHGKYPFFDQEIRNAMTIHAGAVMVPEEMVEQKKRIEAFYQAGGFISPTVDISANKDAKDGFFVIDVDIKKGVFYRVKEVVFKGNYAFSSARLKRKMKTRPGSLFFWRSGRFVESHLKKDIQNLVHFYRRKQYPEIDIQAVTEKDPENRYISIAITLDEGPRYGITFEGNTAFKNRTLKKDLTLFKGGNPNDLGLKKSLRKIKARYRSAGYLQARIKVEEKPATEDDPKTRDLRFVINEGALTTVDSIRITGNASLNDDEIRKQVLTRAPGFRRDGAYLPERLEADQDAIKALYLKNGFMAAEVKAAEEWAADKQKVALNLDITEGTRTRVDSIKITGLTVVPEKSALDVIRLKESDPFRTYMLRNDENVLSALISEKGYPHVKVRGEAAFSPDRSSASVTYRVDEGPHVKMGEVYFGGNLRTRKKILTDEMVLKPGDPFSLTRMLQTQRNIRNLDIVDSVEFKTAGLKEKADSVTLFVEIEEKKPYYVEAGAGYQSDQGLYSHLRFGDRNLLGANKNGWVSGEFSQIGYRGELGISEPRFLGTRTSAVLGLFAEERAELNQDFGTRSYGSTLGFKRKWTKNISTGLNFRFENREQFLEDFRRFLDPGELETRTILVTTPSVRYDTRDSFIRPQKGVLSSFSVDISQGIDNDLDDFARYVYDLRFFTTPVNRLTFACIGRVGYLSPFNSTEKVPTDQLFYLGGISDVRGFDENLLQYDASGDSVGGRFALSGTVEGRIDLGRNFELAVFFDAGRLSETEAINPIGSADFRFSVGMGLRYITPIGPIGLLYGHKLDRQEGESSGQFHFSIGYTF
ncbi:outer membrane protein assembly factor BamA [Thermodesulfobacteriota bacterium]